MSVAVLDAAEASEEPQSACDENSRRDESCDDANRAVIHLHRVVVIALEVIFSRADHDSVIVEDDVDGFGRHDEIEIVRTC